MASSTWFKGLLLFGLYVATAKLGLQLSPIYGVATLVWAPAGLALAALILCGLRLWPALVAAAFAVNVAIVPVPVAAGIAVGNTLATIVGFQLLCRRGRFRPTLDRLQDVARLVVFGAVLAPMVAATVGVTSLWLGGIVPSPDLLRVWSIWWIGDMLGILLVSPALLTWLRPCDWQRQEDLRQGALLLAFASVCLLAFDGGLQGVLSTYSATYFVFPLLIWAAVYFGPRGAAATSLLVAITAIVVTAANQGAFVQGSLRERLLNLQTFMGVVAVTAMALAAIVAERRQSLKHLHQSERLLNESQVLTRIGSWEWDVKTDRITWSEALYGIYGTTPEAFDHTFVAFLRFIHPDDQRRVVDIVQRLVHSPEPQHYEERIIRPDGSERILDSHGRSVRADDGTLMRVVGTCRDVTEQRQQEAMLREQTRQLAFADQRKDAILQSLSEGLILVSDAATVLQVNVSARSLLGRSDGDLLGQSIDGILGLPVANRHLDNHLISLKRADGRTAAVRLNAVPVGDFLTVVTLRDVTHDEAVARMKSEFVSLASHELRTPLTIVSGYLELLLGADRYRLATERRADLLRRIHQQIVRLGHIVDDLLDVARIEQGRKLPDNCAFALGEVIGEVVAFLEPAAAARSTAVRLDGITAALPAVWGAPDHVSQILTNLLDNAIKYSPAGTCVTLAVRRSGAYVRVSVADQGVGIPPEEIPRLFDKFHRIWRRETLAERGSGLGLFIARQLAEAMGGTLLVCSEPGQGSTFAFTLPVAVTAATAPAAA